MSKKIWIPALLVALVSIFLLTSHLISTEAVYEKPVDPVSETIAESDALILPPLQERVGQLVAVGHWADTPASETTALSRDLHLGNVIIMEAPADESAISKWTSAWQDAASSTLIISIDQEGGVVSRLRGEEHIQLAQPEITDTQTARAVASDRADALQALGINANYSPVLDRSTLPDSFMYDRVFRDPTQIALLADAMVRGYQQNGVLAAPKHFPGHPNTADDSHLTLPVLEMTIAEYEKHTEQFSDLIAARNSNFLMTAHVLVPALDPDFPATVSPIVIEDLRTRLGYDGVVITDDLAMQAISDRWSYEESAVLALQAGVDMVMLAAEPEFASSTIAAVVAAVRSGELSEARVNEAYERVQKVKNTIQ